MSAKILKQINRISTEQRNGIIQKALNSAANSGGALIPENLEQFITDTVQRLSPELAMVETKKIKGSVHEFNQLVRRPSRGGAQGEQGTTPTSSSKTSRISVNLKVIRRKGQVTNFLDDASEEYIDAAAYEMENHIQSHVLDLIFYIIWGNTASNTYEFSGLETFITSNRVIASGVPSTLAFLDSMIDKSNRKGGSKHRRAFMMSPEMASLVSSLLTNVRLQQGLKGSGQDLVKVSGGWELEHYRNIPIIETTSLNPIENLTSTVTPSAVNTGGGMSNGTYYIWMVPLTYEGEQSHTTRITQTLADGTSVQRIQLDLNAPHETNDAEGNPVPSALSYKIYMATTDDVTAATLVKVVSAFTYDVDGSPDGENGVDASIFIDVPSGDASVPAHLVADIPLTKAGNYYPESVVLWDLDPIQGLGKLPFTNKAGDRFEGLVNTKPLAETDDWINFLVKSYTALTNAYEASSVWVRGYRVA